MQMLTIKAPAKLNFFLHITGKRPDGYHLIESLAGFTEFGDVLELSEAPTLTLAIDGPYASALGDDVEANLVMRAARALQQYSGTKRGAHIHLTKHIPMGAGLGGGSSDAAATLRGLIELWERTVTPEALHAMARSLGSDVPLCLRRHSAWVSGIGDQVVTVGMDVNGWVVLVNPNLPLLTADVYRGFSGRFTASSVAPSPLYSLGDLVDLMHATHNDLEEPAIRLMPVIAELLDFLRAGDGCNIARMSGSGATCYAIYDNQEQAEKILHSLQHLKSGWWSQMTQLLG